MVTSGWWGENSDWAYVPGDSRRVAEGGWARLVGRPEVEKHRGRPLPRRRWPCIWSSQWIEVSWGDTGDWGIGGGDFVGRRSGHRNMGGRVWTVCGSGRLCSQRKRQCLEETALCREWSGNLVFVCLFVFRKGIYCNIQWSEFGERKGRFCVRNINLQPKCRRESNKRES